MMTKARCDGSISKRRRVLLLGVAISLLLMIAGIVGLSIGLTVRKNNNDVNENSDQAQSTDEPTAIPFSSSSDSENIQGAHVLICPEPGSDPISLQLPNNDGQTIHRVILKTSFPSTLCTLIEVDDNQSTSGNLSLKPVGRSYNGNGWEAYRSSYFTNVIPSTCSEDASTSNVECMVELPVPAAGRKYILNSYQYDLSTKDQAARFLEKTTFGPTIAEISTFTTPHEWVSAQLEYSPTSHRQFFRERSTSWHTETTYQGLLHAGPCEEGARYRKFVFLAKDAKRFLTIATSTIDTNKRVLSVGGHIRAVIDGRVKRGWPEKILAVVDNGRYVLFGNACTISLDCGDEYSSVPLISAFPVCLSTYHALDANSHWPTHALSLRTMCIFSLE
jgi:hypothetical protein